MKGCIKKEQDAGMKLYKELTMKLVVYIHLMMQCISERSACLELDCWFLF